MEPQIRYCTTSDSVSIAYWTMGEGPPLVVYEPLGFSHIQLELAYPELRAWLDRLALGRMVIRFDPRGQGLSQRHLATYPGDASLLDLTAVIDDLALSDFDIWAGGYPAMRALRFVASHPERVRHAVAFCPLMGNRVPDIQMEAVRSLADKDWRVYTEALAQTLLGFSEPQLGHTWAAFIRRSLSQDDWLLMMEAGPPDVEPFLSQISRPTLIIHRAASRPEGLEAARWLASSIPAARLVMIEGRTPLPFGTAEDEVFDAMDDFLGRTERPVRVQPRSAVPSGTAIILFADIANSTALTERLGDAAFREKARKLDEALRPAITANGGTAIDGKLLGDGVLATFSAAREAIACAAAIHDAGSHVGLPLHVGIHAGDVIREHGPDGRDNVYGGAVNIAARVASEAAAAETLVSATVRDLARTSAAVTFEDRGERELKGVSEPVRLYAVQEAVKE